MSPVSTVTDNNNNDDGMKQRECGRLIRSLTLVEALVRQPNKNHSERVDNDAALTADGGISAIMPMSGEVLNTLEGWWEVLFVDSSREGSCLTIDTLLTVLMTILSYSINCDINLWFVDGNRIGHFGRDGIWRNIGISDVSPWWLLDSSLSVLSKNSVSSSTFLCQFFVSSSTDH